MVRNAMSGKNGDKASLSAQIPHVLSDFLNSYRNFGYRSKSHFVEAIFVATRRDILGENKLKLDISY